MNRLRTTVLTGLICSVPTVAMAGGGENTDGSFGVFVMVMLGLAALWWGVGERN